MEENKVSNPKPLFLRALLKEAQSDWTRTAASSMFQPASHWFLPSCLGPENRCSKAFWHGSAKPSASLPSTDEITSYFTKILEAIYGELSTSCSSDSKFIFIFTRVLLVPCPCFRILSPFNVESAYPSLGLYALQPSGRGRGLSTHCQPPLLSLISPLPAALSHQAKTGLKTLLP